MYVFAPTVNVQVLIVKFADCVNVPGIPVAPDGVTVVQTGAVAGVLTSYVHTAKFNCEPVVETISALNSARVVAPVAIEYDGKYAGPPAVVGRVVVPRDVTAPVPLSKV
jgi:hypothetical protein